MNAQVAKRPMLRQTSDPALQNPGRSRKRRAFRFVPLFVLVAAQAVATPVMPMGFERIHSDDSGRTWRETGRIRQPLAMAKATVRTSMRGQGYSLVHDIASDNVRSLQFWRRTDEDAILLLWQENLHETGVAWGISNRDDDSRAEDPKVSAASALRSVANAGIEADPEDSLASMPVSPVPGFPACAEVREAPDTSLSAAETPLEIRPEKRVNPERRKTADKTTAETKP